MFSIVINLVVVVFFGFAAQYDQAHGKHAFDLVLDGAMIGYFVHAAGVEFFEWLKRR